MTVPTLAPTPDLDRALRDIETDGFTIIPDMLMGDALASTRDALYRAAECDRARGREQRLMLDYEHDRTNQRVANVLSRDPLFEDLAFHPAAVHFVKSVLGWPALLSNFSANITGPGGGEMVLHADQIVVPEPWSDRPQGLNIGWCLDDFTEENGATRVVPGSHKHNRFPKGDDNLADTIALEAKAGSMLVFESRLWHHTGNNITKDERRAGIFGWYTTSIYRTQENWFLSLKPEIRQFATDEMLVLLGYKAAGLGVVNGASSL
jgi:ectoine hydroxylase-related dioxygenase (phytanoyl-CoA dioxygenase family)